MRYAQIEAMRPEFPVSLMCRVLSVSESGYHAWRGRPPSAKAQEAARLELEVKAAHIRTRETCGPERLQQDLADHEFIASSVYAVNSACAASRSASSRRRLIRSTIFQSPRTCLSGTSACPSRIVRGLGI